MFDRNKNGSSSQADKDQATASPAPSPQPEARAPAAASGGAKATIGPSIRIKGDVSGDENLLVEGTVEGTVRLAEHELIVGKSGKVHADITAKLIRIDGEVEGDINGKEKVILSASCTVRGNIITPRMSLEDGAKFKGSIDMDPGSSTGKSGGGSGAGGGASATGSSAAGASGSADSGKSGGGDKSGNS